MAGVTIFKPPLFQHKLTLLRKKDVSTKSFRELLKEIGMLLCYEVTRDLPLTHTDLENPPATCSFGELLKESGMLLCYEVTRDLPLTDTDIETPLAPMKSSQIAGKKL